MPQSEPALTVIIAARNEEILLGRCLSALLEQDEGLRGVEVVVAANACTDRTVAIARAAGPRFTARGWALKVLDIPEGGKTGALNAGDRAAKGRHRVYLDADVVCEPALLGQLARALERPEPLYATGVLVVAPGATWVTRAYAQIWTRLPFVTGGAVGAGLFALNSSGRERWGDWPPIISDDTFARLNFAPHERIEVAARYHWPMVEGFSNLVHVRRRQNTGVAEVYRLYPNLKANEGKASLNLGDLWRLFLAAPFGFAVYLAVNLAVRARRSGNEWTRGR